MRYYSPLYLGRGIKFPFFMKLKLRLCINQARLFLIMVSEGKDQLEIIHTSQLLFAPERYKDAYVVGAAAGHRDSLLLVRDICEDIYIKHGICDMKQYFLDNIHG